MTQLGERLRTAREEQGISISQAAVETRILQRYLIALEDGDYQHLPGDVYARGFIRNYATYLGLSAEELIELYRRERGITDQIRVVPATSSPRIRGLFVPSFFGVFFVVLILVGLGYLALSATNNIGQGMIAEAPTSTSVPTPTSLPTPLPAPTGETQSVLAVQPTAPSTPPDTAGGAAPTPAPTATPQAAPIVVEVRIQEGDNPGSWMRVDRDNETTQQRVFKPGESVTVEAQRNVTMVIGNPGVVYITVNGQPYGSGPVGQPGVPFTFVWPQQ